MAAKLQGRKAGTLEARQIVCKHIDEALSALKGKRPSDISIHKARKAIKKARAVWRLLRQGLPEVTYRYTNSRLRDAGRPLGAARDAKILVVSVDKLLAKARGTNALGYLRAVRRTLLENGDEIQRVVRSEPSGLALSRQALRSARQRIRNYSIAKHGWSTLGKGLSRVYRSGRRMYHRARGERRVEDLHEWRKQAKYLHHQLTVLKPLWKGPIGKLSGEAASLADRLGDDHDLAVLRRQISGPQTAIAPDEQRTVVKLIENERRRLQNAAFMLGARIYEEKPADFFVRFGGYWQEWRHPKKKA
jgi:CHAD domain-containing protein